MHPNPQASENAMKTKIQPKEPPASKQGFLLFYVMGTVALLSLAAMIAVRSANLESRTSRNHLDTTRALYHAESGVKLVKRAVENRLMNGEDLQEILETLRITPPNGITFDPIESFRVIVPGRIFSFESIGRSNGAMASVVVQFRRRPLLQAGLFGVDSLNTQPNVKIYGYDSRVVSEPTVADSNAGASIGSNGVVDLGNHVILDGMILLGETDTGFIANCNRCTSYMQVQVGHQDPDPLGLLDGGAMQSVFNEKVVSNQNSLVTKIESTVIDLSSGNPNTRVITLTSGDYYLTNVNLGSSAVMTIDDSTGPVRIFMDGRFNMQPGSNVIVNSGKPFGFQIYSRSLENINLQPNGSMTAYVYAPNALINLQPGNHVRGAFWGKRVNVQPGQHGAIWLDTSLSERMLMNNLEIHAWYEQHVN